MVGAAFGRVNRQNRLGQHGVAFGRGRLHEERAARRGETRRDAAGGWAVAGVRTGGTAAGGADKWDLGFVDGVRSR